jgi:abortive infection bacteriophage resistance protein
MKFEKPAISIPEQIALMQKRGLKIEDEAEATHYLKFVGYYRLSGYALPLSNKRIDGTHNFKAGATFTDILNLYRFDRELRLLMMDAIERVEVAFRTCLSNTMAVKYGAHWYLNTDLFFVAEECKEFVRRIIDEIGIEADGSLKAEKGRDVYIEHYFTKYKSPQLPPAWMIAEMLSISCWSKVYQNLASRENKKLISQEFGLNPEILAPWIRAICYTRNICAHHGRLWNRQFTFVPAIAKGHEKHLSNNVRFYAQAYVINQLLLKASPASKWWQRFMDLIAAHPYIDKDAMGFPK